VATSLYAVGITGVPGLPFLSSPCLVVVGLWLAVGRRPHRSRGTPVMNQVKSRPRTSRLVAASVAALLGLSACGGSNDGDGGKPVGGHENIDGGGATGDARDPGRQGPATIEGAEKGGIVKLISARPLATMDPSEAYDTPSDAILSGLVTRSLTQYVYDPETGTPVLVPDLATDLGTSNEDYTEWSFTLRDGIKYEDGTPVTIEDLKFGLERTMDTMTFPGSPGFYSRDYYEGGADYPGPYTGNGAVLDSITTAGNTVTVKMATSFPDMPYWMAFPANGPIPQSEASDPATYRNHPLATGPYKFAEYTPGKALTLVRNPHWDPDTDPGRTAYPDGYEMDFTVPNEQIDEILLNDQGDAKNSLSFDDILGTSYRTFLDRAGDRLVTGTTPCTSYWAMDYRRIADIDVRHALAFAYPYSAAIKAGGSIEGLTRIVGTNLLPPGTPGRTEYEPLGVPAGTTDPGRSRDLLADAGQEGYEIRFLFATDDPTSVAAKDAIAKGLAQGGFKATPVPTTLDNLATVQADPDADINVRDGAWCADWPSGGSWFPPLLRTEELEELGQISYNYSVFSEEDVDNRIEHILSLPVEEHAEAWDELDEYISTTYFPHFVTAYIGSVWAHGSNVNGAYSDVVLGMPTFKNIHLSSQRR
jgi:peptide/nickel transport system substrate-binding protein